MTYEKLKEEIAIALWRRVWGKNPNKAWSTEPGDIKRNYRDIAATTLYVVQKSFRLEQKGDEKK